MTIDGGCNGRAVYRIVEPRLQALLAVTVMLKRKG